MRPIKIACRTSPSIIPCPAPLEHRAGCQAIRILVREDSRRFRCFAMDDASIRSHKAHLSNEEPTHPRLI